MYYVLTKFKYEAKSTGDAIYKIRLWPYPVLLIATLRNDEHVTIAGYLASLPPDTSFVCFVQSNLGASFLLTVGNMIVLFIYYLTNFPSITLTFRSRFWHGDKDMTLVAPLAMNLGFQLCNKDQ